MLQFHGPKMTITLFIVFVFLILSFCLCDSSGLLNPHRTKAAAEASCKINMSNTWHFPLFSFSDYGSLWPVLTSGKHLIVSTIFIFIWWCLQMWQINDFLSFILALCWSAPEDVDQTVWSQQLRCCEPFNYKETQNSLTKQTQEHEN